MPFITYILKSETAGTYYCGQTDNIEQRLQRHNEGKVKSTKHGVPWVLIGKILLPSCSESMQLEKKIKSRGITRWLSENSNLLQ